MRGLAILGTLGLAGCFTSASTEECRVDSDCSGLICTRVGACATSAHSLRVEWTVRGLTADRAEACAGIAELELTASDPITSEAHAVRPVPCEIGSFTFDKLPLGYTDITISAFDAARNLIDIDRSSADSDGTVRITLLRGR